MVLKKLFLAISLVFVLAVVVADTAMATATATNGFWYKESVKLASGVEEAVNCSSVGSFVFESTATEGGITSPVKLTATGVSCPNGKIFNEGSKAKGTGKIKFTGVKETAGCEVPGETIESKALVEQVYMEGATKALVRFAPASGTIFAGFAISGGSCALDEFYKVEGVLFGEMTNVTNISATLQELRFTGAINSAAGGSLTFISEASFPATLTGASKFGLATGKQLKVNET